MGTRHIRGGISAWWVQGTSVAGELSGNTVGKQHWTCSGPLWRRIASGQLFPISNNRVCGLYKALLCSRSGPHHQKDTSGNGRPQPLLKKVPEEDYMDEEEPMDIGRLEGRSCSQRLPLGGWGWNTLKFCHLFTFFIISFPYSVLALFGISNFQPLTLTWYYFNNQKRSSSRRRHRPTDWSVDNYDR